MDHKNLALYVTQAEENIREKYSSIEAALAQHEDRSRRDNISVVNLPEKVEKKDPLAFVSSSLQNLFPSLAREKTEAVRANRIVPEHNAGPPHSLICKMLHFTYRDRLLKASRNAPVTVTDKEIHFCCGFQQLCLKMTGICSGYGNSQEVRLQCISALSCITQADPRCWGTHAPNPHGGRGILHQ